MLRKNSGSSLLIPLIIFAVLWAISTVLAYVAFSNYTEQRASHSDAVRDKELWNKHLSSEKADHAELSTLIGFKTDASRYADTSAIEMYIASRKKLQDTTTYSYYVIESGTGTFNFDTGPFSENSLFGTRLTAPFRIERVTSSDLVLVTTLQELLEKQDTLLSSVIDANKAIAKLQLTVATEATAALGRKDGEIKRLGDELNNERSRARTEKSALENEKRMVEEQVRAKDEEILRSIKDLASEVLEEKDQTIDSLYGSLRDARRKIKELQEDLESLRVERASKTLKRDEPDGRVIHSIPDLRYVTLDLGNLDGVVPGLRFKVFRLKQAGERHFLGAVEVKKVLGPHTSRCGVIELYDEADPIQESDYVINELYEKSRYLKFAFAGKFGGQNTQYSRVHASNLLSEFGATVVDVVDPTVDIVIVGADYETDPNYRRAQELKIETMTERQLHFYLGYQSTRD
jgi:hypothetical protein